MDNRTKLNALRSKKRTLKDLEQKIVSFNPTSEVGDTAKDYRTGKPKTIILQGYGDENYVRLKDLYSKQWHKTLSAIIEAERIIEGIDDTELQEIIRMRYVDGKSQTEIAEEIGYSQQAVSYKIENFFKGE